MFIPASALLAMHSTYIGQLMQPAAASLIVRMCIHLGGVAIMLCLSAPCNVPINPTCIIVMVQSHLGIIAWTIE